MNRRWICGDVWMDIFPSFDRPQLGLKMALLSDRFDCLVDKHFDGTTELTLWSPIKTYEGIGSKAKLSVLIDGKGVRFPMPDHPLPNKIRFRFLQIDIFFISSRTLIIPSLHFSMPTSTFNLRRRTSPTILTDLDQLNSIDSGGLLPDGIADDGPNATVGQVLSKWLHTPSKNAQPKRFRRNNFFGQPNLEWVNNFKEAFLSATSSVSYTIQLYFRMPTTPIEQFELVNKVTYEKLTLKLSEESIEFKYNWQLKRCPIWETAPIKFDPRYGNNSLANLNSVRFELRGKHCIGPLSRCC